MKNINQQIFEDVLEPIFPGEYVYHWDNPDGDEVADYWISYSGNEGPHRQPADYISDAFWLAEEIGLFHYKKDRMFYLTGTAVAKEWFVGEFLYINNHDFRGVGLKPSRTWGSDKVPVAICMAILDIYGKKNEQ